ncbi:MAG: nitrous oxide reductase accessory protein NosL [Nitrospiraceae bacterium]|nr:nitrous oxide reductase accessory protein NosL [Nitrospiraceae bacterium]
MKYRMIAVSLLALILFGAALVSQASEDDIQEHRSCVRCGMDRKAYGYSRMMIRYEDGAEVGVCSLHCAVAEMNAEKGRTVKSLLVADRNTRALIDAEKAFWVVGGKKRGVMTATPKWAFGTEEGARAFVRADGGTIATWKEVLKATEEELAPAK